MRRRLTILVSALAFSALTVSPALGHSASPCDDSGEPGNSDYAQHHIVPLAQEQGLGEGGHKPGTHHGYSLCLDGP